MAAGDAERAVVVTDGALRILATDTVGVRRLRSKEESRRKPCGAEAEASGTASSSGMAMLAAAAGRAVSILVPNPMRRPLSGHTTKGAVPLGGAREPALAETAEGTRAGGEVEEFKGAFAALPRVRSPTVVVDAAADDRRMPSDCCFAPTAALGANILPGSKVVGTCMPNGREKKICDLPCA